MDYIQTAMSFFKMHFPCIASAQSKDIPSELRKSSQELQNPKPLRGHGSPVGCHAGAVSDLGAWADDESPTPQRKAKSHCRDDCLALLPKECGG